MSKWDKLIQRIKSLDKNLRFEEIQKVLEYFGYEVKVPRRGGKAKKGRGKKEKSY